MDANSTPSQTWLILTLTALLLQLVLTGFTFFRNAPSQDWEYVTTCPSDPMFDVEANEMGAEGWEIASARRATNDIGACYEIIWKRPT